MLQIDNQKSSPTPNAIKENKKNNVKNKITKNLEQPSSIVLTSYPNSRNIELKTVQWRLDYQ